MAESKLFWDPALTGFHARAHWALGATPKSNLSVFVLHFQEIISFLLVKAESLVESMSYVTIRKIVQSQEI